ncbi:conjugal transfer pilus assembly protein TraU [Fastidiosibacter lacustris]|uniref:conjugal transfer pilus assembly protein TraU n=1 Tax=Fastidiosibacter lacustris TaxID=2056695 RepID=UPI001EFE5C4F|nr:conjugal transfer pilus assembly protein TraU [Fastidiosibacter lacustris]
MLGKWMQLIKTTIIKIGLGCCLALLVQQSYSATGTCTGRFVNPITDISWASIFPMTIGKVPVIASALGLPDTPNPTSPVVGCNLPPPLFYRIGITIGYWEPYALTDVTRIPYCMVNMGFEMPLGLNMQQIGGAATGGTEVASAGGRQDTNAQFFHVHWYKYPIIYWLQLIQSAACMATDNYDILYMSELDPLWDDDLLAFYLNPEAILFGNPVIQLACIAESVLTSANVALPLDVLFWCAGSQGSMYPLTGTVSSAFSDASNAVLLTERMNYKLHREGLVLETVPEWPAICYQYYAPILPKSRYRYQYTNVVPEPYISHPYTTTTMISEAGKNNIVTGDNFGFLNFKKRNCVFL